MTTSDEPLNLGLLLFIPYRAMETAVLDALAAAGHPLPLNQARVFQRIAPEGSRLATLAAASQLPKQTVGSIVDQLERSSYVTRTPDPTDARARLVTLTSRGHELVATSLPVVRAVEAQWRAHLGEERAAQLRELLTDLREISDPFRG